MLEVDRVPLTELLKAFRAGIAAGTQRVARFTRVVDAMTTLSPTLRSRVEWLCDWVCCVATMWGQLPAVKFNAVFLLRAYMTAQLLRRGAAAVMHLLSDRKTAIELGVVCVAVSSKLFEDDGEFCMEISRITPQLLGKNEVSRADLQRREAEVLSTVEFFVDMRYVCFFSVTELLLAPFRDAPIARRSLACAYAAADRLASVLVVKQLDLQLAQSGRHPVALGAAVAAAALVTAGVVEDSEDDLLEASDLLAEYCWEAEPLLEGKQRGLIVAQIARALLDELCVAPENCRALQQRQQSRDSATRAMEHIDHAA
jgi:hypothetical protein